MKAEELRIGNYVNEKHYGLRRVVCIDNREGYDNVYRDAYGDATGGFIRPIPLTEEWLLKFGLLNLNDYSFDGGCLYIDLLNKCIGVAGEEAVTCGMIYYAKCEYVHQLQNLYFALTGKELEIK